MLKNIVSIDGDKIKNVGEPDKEVIKFAKDILNKAKKGTICGLAVVSWNANDIMEYEIVGDSDSSFTMIGAIESMKTRVMINTEEDLENEE